MTWTCGNCGYGSNPEIYGQCRNCGEYGERSDTTQVERDLFLGYDGQPENSERLTTNDVTIPCGCGEYEVTVSELEHIHEFDVICPKCGNHFGFSDPPVPDETAIPDVADAQRINVDGAGSLREASGDDSDAVRRIAVDFDNTLTESNVEYWNGEHPEPDEEMIEWVNDQYNSGKTIIVWTARQWAEAGRIAGHCTEWGVKFHGIRCGKGSADLYVDDCALHPSQIGTSQ